jgi:glycosyltransferase involved in cell wall biosynthesis
MSDSRQRLLIFIVAYHAATTIRSVVQRIPQELTEQYDCELLIIDDSSKDETFKSSHNLSTPGGFPFPIRVLYNPINQGYGGNQKLGYRYAIDHGFDLVALVHGDGQYAPESLPLLLAPVAQGKASAVFGSRMLTATGALKGGMPLYKYVGNRVLTWTQNKLLRTSLSEFHSGYRIYATKALRTIPFELNSNDFHFDTEIIIQLVIAKQRIEELPIPTFYGDEICRVNGMAYAYNVIKATLRARFQEWSLFYDRRYDCRRSSPEPVTRLEFRSPESFALKTIKENATVLDLGHNSALTTALQQEKHCTAGTYHGINYQQRDHMLDHLPIEATEYILLLDVLEHLSYPEAFLDELRSRAPQGEVIVSAGNIGFLITRLMLTIGQFNYGRRGILDLTHTRLFTFKTLSRLLEQSGFTVIEKVAMPAPFPLAIRSRAWSGFLLRLNTWLIRLSPGLFGYQVVLRARALPTVESLLALSGRTTELKRSEYGRQAIAS